MNVSQLLSVGALLWAMSCVSPVRAVLVLNETFDTDTAFTKADDGGPASFFTDGSNLYWGINDPDAIALDSDDYDGDPDASGVPAYTGFNGNFLNGEYLSGDGDTLPLSLTWNNLPILGLTNLMFSGLFAAQSIANEANFDTGDYVWILYRIDSNVGPFSDLLRFSRQDIDEDDGLAVDADFNGVGEGTVLTEIAALFSASIPGTGATLDLRILMSVNDDDKAFAFDTLTITGVPEPAAFLFGGLVCGVVGLTVIARRLRDSFVCASSHKQAAS